MLVLARKENERVVVGNEIVIHVQRIGREIVKLGFEAPFHIKIHRDELREGIGRDNPDDLRTQIPSLGMMESLQRLDKLAAARGVPAHELLNELMRRVEEEPS